MSSLKMITPEEEEERRAKARAEQLAKRAEAIQQLEEEEKYEKIFGLSQKQFEMRNLTLANFPKGIIDSDIYWVDSPEEINFSRDYFQQFTEKDLIFTDEGKIGNDEYHFYRFSTIE